MQICVDCMKLIQSIDTSYLALETYLGRSKIIFNFQSSLNFVIYIWCILCRQGVTFNTRCLVTLPFPLNAVHKFQQSKENSKTNQSKHGCKNYSKNPKGCQTLCSLFSILFLLIGVQGLEQVKARQQCRQ